LTAQEIKEVMDILGSEGLGEGIDPEYILSITPEQLEAVADPVERQQLSHFQSALRAMVEDL
jgi:hypothetical protein